MRIGIDARAAYDKNLRGIGKSLTDLYQHISRISVDCTFIPYYSLSSGDQSSFPSAPNVQEKPLTMWDWGDRFELWREVRLPIAAKMDSIDVLHCPAQFSPKIKSVPTVVTIHDVIPLVTETGISKKSKLAFKNNIAHSLSHAKKIITISEYSKSDILLCYPNVDPYKITVIPWAANSSYKRISDIEKKRKIRESYGIGEGSFFVSFGGDAPRKNTKRLVESFMDFCASTDNWRLVVVGLSQELLKELQYLVDEAGLSKRFCLKTYIDDEDVPLLLSTANAFIFPSIYEGFGLPLLDAMACGCPILSSNLTSLPEIAGDAAIYFNPLDKVNMTNCLLSFTQDEELAVRLADLGYKRNRNFTWDKTAQATLDVFESIK